MSLFDDIEVGAVHLPNRAVFRAVRSGLADDGRPTADLAAHLAARAAGGAGMVVGPAEMLVHPGASGPTYVDAHDESNVSALANVARAVQDAGAPIVGQLTHPGAEETGDWEMQAQVAPGGVASDAAYELPKQAEDDDLDAIRDGFVTSAEHLVEADFDAVELSAGPNAVLRQFLSPKYNTRDDEYGGDWAKRARYVNEVLDAVGRAVDVPVGLHLSLAELEYGGYGFEDVPDVLAELSGFDYLSCTIGTLATYDRTHAGLAVEAPALAGHVTTAAAAVDVPVIGREPFTTVEAADRLLDEGADLVSFTRQLLADPGTIEKRATDRTPSRCIECNQKCLEGVYGHAHGGHVECVVEPRTGREAELDPLEDVDEAARPREVLVVGGGPAGLHVAAVAAQRGHDVTVREAAADLGGQLKLAAQGPLEPLGRAVADLEREATAAGVKIELEEPVTADSVENDWDAVIVATGGNLPDPTAEFGGPLVDGFDVLRDGASAVGDVDDVLLYDDNRWVITHLTGLVLLDAGADLEMVTRDHYPGFRTEQPNLPGFVAALQARGATFTGNHALDDVTANGTAQIRNTLTGEVSSRAADAVVVVGRRQAAESLYRELDAVRDDVYRVGDAVSPRKLDRAYFDGELLGRRI